MSKTRH